LLAHTLRHPDARYTIAPHVLDHGIVYETARTDLLDLTGDGLLIASKQGRTWVFLPAAKLERMLPRPIHRRR